MTALPDPRRIIGNIARLGTIASVDRTEATCRVRIGEIVTGDIAWFAPRAGATTIWSPPSVGEQCLLICPEGDTDDGVAILGLFSDANPAPSTDDVDLIRFADGAVVSYDANAHHLVVRLPAGASADVVAPGGLKITGPVAIEGDVTITGKATASDDIVASGKSLKGHMHTKVQAGAAISGPPQ